MDSIAKKYGLSLLMLSLVLSPAAFAASTSSLPAPPSTSAQASAPGAFPSSSDLRVEVSAIEGTVSVQKSGASSFVEIKSSTAILHSGDVIRTVDGTCRLTIDGKNTIHLLPNTVLGITESLRSQAGADSTRLTLESGQLMAKLSKIKDGSKFEVVTPTAIAAVRGTTFYLKQGIFAGQPGSQLYVDESKSGVDFTNLQSKQSFFIPAFSLSQALADGTLDAPSPLNKEAREVFIKNWNASSGGPAQQFGIEEIPLNNPAATSSIFGSGGTFKESLLSDAVLDRIAEQNIPGINGLPLPSVTPLPGFVPKEEPNETPGEEPTEEPTQEPTEEPTDEPTEEPTEEPGPTNAELEAQERAMIRQQIALIRGDQDFDRADANLAQISDSQTGKVFTDVHGYRVRVNQYIFLENFENQSSVSLLSLTARTGPYQNGVSSFQLRTLFNRSIGESDGPLRDLPWNDWMRLVTDEQLTGADLLFPSEQYIVHEHHPSFNEGPDLYPTGLLAIFANSGQTAESVGALIAMEVFGIPEFVQADQGDFWVQGLVLEVMGVGGAGGAELAVTHSPLIPSNAQINQETTTLSSSDGAQTAGLSGDPRLGNLDTTSGVDAFRSSAVHPAFFEDRIGGNHIIRGMFLPINDQGQVIDAPGFRIRGLRDLVFPNTAVNGGNYNLQTIFVIGLDSGEGLTESFRVDTIITPEIFTNYGLKNPSGSRDTSTAFPSSLD